MVGLNEGSQAQHIGGCAIENKVGFGVRSEQSLKELISLFANSVRSIGGSMISIHSYDRIQNSRMSARMVIARKSAFELRREIGKTRKACVLGRCHVITRCA